MYAKEHQPNHPRADESGFVASHIIIAERVLGRYLTDGELVHHCNFRKWDNAETNLLFPLTRKEHQQLPAFQARFIIERGLYGEFLKWWREAKDIIDTEQEIQNQLVLAENQRKRMQVKMRKANES